MTNPPRKCSTHSWVKTGNYHHTPALSCFFNVLPPRPDSGCRRRSRPATAPGHLSPPRSSHLLINRSEGKLGGVSVPKVCYQFLALVSLRTRPESQSKPAPKPGQERMPGSDAASFQRMSSWCSSDLPLIRFKLLKVARTWPQSLQELVIQIPH